MPSNRISFGGQKRRASENRPNRKQDEIESKEYCHEKQRIRATVLCAILTNKPEYGKSYRNRPAKRSMPPRIFRTIRKYEFKSDGTTKKGRCRNTVLFLPTVFGITSSCPRWSSWQPSEQRLSSHRPQPWKQPASQPQLSWQPVSQLSSPRRLQWPELLREQRVLGFASAAVGRIPNV